MRAGLGLFAFFLLIGVGLAACGRGTKVGAGAEKRMSKFFLEIEDGDTVIYKGTHMRFLGVDTPELKNPGLGFYEDQPYGRVAKEFTRAEVRKAKRLTYASDGLDRYERLLVHLFVDGYPLSLMIIEAGLGYETVSAFGDNGFPELSGRILDAAALHPNLPFEEPYIWRRKHRKRQRDPFSIRTRCPR